MPAVPNLPVQSLDVSFCTALSQLDQDPRNVEAIHSFAMNAQHQGAHELAARAHYVVATAHATMQRYQEAELAIETATRVASRAGSALRHEADFFRAIVLAHQGLHDQSSRLLIAVVSGKHFGELRPRVRLDCLRHLAEQCVAAGAIDAALDCWTLLETEAQATVGSVPFVHRLLKACAYLDIHVYGDPAFATMIEAGLGEPASGSLRNTLLALADEECSRALAMAEEERAGVCTTLAKLVPMLIAAARTSRARDAAAAAEAFEFAECTPPLLDAEFRSRAVAALIRTEQWQRARQLLDTSKVSPVGPVPSLPTLKLQYFKCLVLRAESDVEGALELYGEYAQQATSTMRHMNLHLRTLMRTITERAGLRPRDRPAYVPRYLVHAQKLLSSGAQAQSVADVAREVGVSERTLREAFAVHESKTPKQFQIHARLDIARTLLASDAGAKLTVEEIAAAAGFTHAGRFARKFRERFGVTVGQFKQGSTSDRAGKNPPAT
jgi:AraC-like DNA-binding protein